GRSVDDGDEQVLGTHDGRLSRRVHSDRDSHYREHGDQAHDEPAGPDPADTERSWHVRDTSERSLRNPQRTLGKLDISPTVDPVASGPAACSRMRGARGGE